MAVLLLHIIFTTAEKSKCQYELSEMSHFYGSEKSGTSEVPKRISLDTEPELFKARKTETVPGKPGRMGSPRKLDKEEEYKKRWYLLLCKYSEWRTGTGLTGVAECGNTQALTGTV